MHALDRILVVKLATLGDLLTITPALRALRTSFPTAHIGLLTTAVGALVAQYLDTVDEITTFDKFAFDRPVDAARGLPNALALAHQLRAGEWDTLLLLHHLTTPFGTAKYAALSLGSGAQRRVGLDNGRGWFLTESAVDRGFGWQHEVDYWLDVASVVGAERPAEPRLEMPGPPEADDWASEVWERLDLASDVVLLGPGSGAFSRARRWSPQRFAEVGRRLLRDHGLQPVVQSGLDADEQALAQYVAADIGPDARVAPPAPTPHALGALIRRCRILVANDSGPVHIATAVGTPVVAIFGPSNDGAWGPYPASDPGHQVARDVVACQPCIHRGHSFGTPQGCLARTCLAIVGVDQVVSAAERALRAVSTVVAR